MAVHRYKANESGSSEKATKKPAKTVSKTASAKKSTTKEKVTKPAKVTKARKPIKLFAPFVAVKNYVVNSWHELKQVHWPNRKQTWILTIAVIIFSLLLGAVIFGLDAGFTYLFKTVIF